MKKILEVIAAIAITILDLMLEFIAEFWGGVLVVVVLMWVACSLARLECRILPPPPQDVAERCSTAPQVKECLQLYGHKEVCKNKEDW